MAVNIKNAEVERLLDEVVAATGESKTEAVRQALLERKARLGRRGLAEGGVDRFLRYLAEDVWPEAPAGELGRRLSKEEEESLLGLGPDGT